MVIKTLSEKRGIIAFYDGDKYIIYSTCYGVVAESKPVIHYDYNKKTGETTHYDKINIEFDICKWYGYWSLKDIITRGIKKLEREDCRVAECNITYHEIEGADSHLNKRLVVSTEDY